MISPLRCGLALIAILTAACSVAWAQEDRVSRFDDYEEYARFMDETIEARDYITLLNRIGAADEMTVQQMQGLKAQLDSLIQSDLDQVTVWRQIDLGGGMQQEVRSYWTGDVSYLHVATLLHKRPDGLVLLEVSMNTRARNVFPFD